MECGDCNKIEKLRIENGEDRIPEKSRCQKMGCRYSWLHVTDGHFCSKCGGNHSLQECKKIKPKIKYQIKCPLCLAINMVPEEQKEVYGINETCVVCEEREVKLYLPACGHTFLCLICAETMNKKEFFSI